MEDRFLKFHLQKNLKYLVNVLIIFRLIIREDNHAPYYANPIIFDY